ncbi:MAG: hypothetical protein CSA22_03400 [Deltaproteobacteria bacterium]|nr:MAG: hypothetical protein CSA22_03400 [Deltaproteobacteria bacterium]
MANIVSMLSTSDNVSPLLGVSEASELLSITTEARPKIHAAWEMSQLWKCPLMGMCLSIDEHRKLLKPLGFKVKQMSHYEMHGVIMNGLQEEGRLARRVDRFIRQKYRDAFEKYTELPEKKLMAAWRKGFRSGEMEDLFVSVAFRPDLSEASITEVYADVHMAGHMNMADVLKERRKVVRLETAVADAEKQRKDAQKKARRLEDRVRELEQLLARAEKDNEALSKQVAVLESRVGSDEMVAENDRLQSQVRKAVQRCEHLEGRAVSAEAAHVEAMAELDALKARNRDMADTLGDLLSNAERSMVCACNNDGGDSHCSEDCPNFDLCQKRVLVVGGITRMKHLYKRLVESGGGLFEYHDGYMKGGKEALEARIRRSDVVLCPVTCNSHGACGQVKMLCKKFNKPMQMLPGSSLSMLSSALTEDGGAISGISARIGSV